MTVLVKLDELGLSGNLSLLVKDLVRVIQSQTYQSMAKSNKVNYSNYSELRIIRPRAIMAIFNQSNQSNTNTVIINRIMATNQLVTLNRQVSNNLTTVTNY